VSWALWTLVGLPAVVGVALTVAGRRAERAAPSVGVLASAVSAALALVCVLARPQVRVPFVLGGDLGLAVDALSALVLPAVAVVALLVLVFCVAEMRESTARFFGLMLAFEAAVLMTVTATTLVALLLPWEVMGATSYALIGFSWRETARVDGGRTAFLTTRAADLGLYVAAGAALAGTGSLDLASLAGASTPWRHVAAAGIVVAALGKAAQLPFSFWLSRAMEGPSPVSALLHSAAMVAMGGYLLLRVQPLLSVTGWAGPVVAWAGALTTVLLGLVAVAQTDLKQLLAASTAAQLGFVVLAAGSGGVAAGGLQLVAHAAVKSLLFLVAGVWLRVYGTRDLRRLAGAARSMPVVGACFLVGALALAGLPPLSLWVTKDEALAAAGDMSVALYVTGLLGAVLSAVYAGKALFMLLRPSAPARQRVPWLTRAPLVVLAAAAAGLGLLGLPVFADPLRSSLGGAPAAGVAALLVSGLLSVGGLLLARRRPTAPLRLPALAADWLGLERVVTLALVRPVLRLAGALARFDDRQLAGAVLGAAAGTGAMARASAGFDVHAVAGGVRGVAERTRRLGILAVRPQTGQLHNYYAQAAVVLVAAFVLLLLRS